MIEDPQLDWPVQHHYMHAEYRAGQWFSNVLKWPMTVPDIPHILNRSDSRGVDLNEQLENCKLESLNHG